MVVGSAVLFGTFVGTVGNATELIAVSIGVSDISVDVPAVSVAVSSLVSGAVSVSGSCCVWDDVAFCVSVGLSEETDAEAKMADVTETLPDTSAEEISESDDEPKEDTIIEEFSMTDGEEVPYESEIDNDPVLNELIYGESYDDTPPESSQEPTLDRTIHLKPEYIDLDVMDSADDGVKPPKENIRVLSSNTGVNAFNSLSPEQQAKILDADYEDDY